MSLDGLLSTALELAHRAGSILAERFGGERQIDFKGGIDLVTDADRAAEEAMLELLRTRHPDHAVLAEESGASRGAGYRWILDPLDGTTNYSHAIPHFSVSVAVEDGEGVAVGVVHDPLRRETFAARRGQGATLNRRPIHVSQVERLDRALLCTGFPYDVRERPEAPLALFHRLVTKAQGVRRFGSAALDLAWVACGRYDGFFEFRLKPWDIAAGALLIREAGGTITRIDGAPWDTSATDVLAAGTSLQPQLISETAPILRDLGWSPQTG